MILFRQKISAEGRFWSIILVLKKLVKTDEVIKFSEVTNYSVKLQWLQISLCYSPLLAIYRSFYYSWILVISGHQRSSCAHLFAKHLVLVCLCWKIATIYFPWDKQATKWWIWPQTSTLPGSIYILLSVEQMSP